MGGRLILAKIGAAFLQKGVWFSVDLLQLLMLSDC